jgi:hypothetical protein
MEGPVGLPTCEHGFVFGGSKHHSRGCQQCNERDKAIREAVKPMADEFWAYRGQREIEHLLYRAYRMGMRHDRT